MKKSFLGRGIAFPVGLDARGNLSLTDHERNIEESIRVILGTAVGERVMRPQFGCKIHDFVFYPNNSSTSALVSFYVRESLVKWEPRIEEVSVTAQPDPALESSMQVNISYRVRRTNNLRNLVYPFYLRREQDL
ncbi:MAG: GPW/gp25 family protein [Deltaproteobacteria bacterium]|nr:GPW/gp25 family protein [Deltaproteobacteria bacterium]